MNLITVDISGLREKLSDYLTLVRAGKAVVSVRNAKSGKEIARIVMPPAKKVTDDLIDKRIAELRKIAGFAAGYSNKNRERLEKMGKDYSKKLLKGIIE